MNTIHIKSDLSHAITAFNSFKKESVIVRMDKGQIASLIVIINKFIESHATNDSILEIIVLKEIKVLLTKKFNIISTRANVPFNCSQSRTLFLWLNDYHFDHPLEESFSCWLIDQIYRQVV